MGVLGLIIPGVREIRTPLVVGWLWMGMLWVLSGLVPATWYDLPPHLTVPIWFNDLGPVARASILSVVAFFVGISVGPLQGLVLWVAKRLFAVTIAVGAVLAFATVGPLILPIALTVSGTAVAVVVVGLAWYHVRVHPIGLRGLRAFIGRVTDAVAQTTDSRLKDMRLRYRSIRVGDYYGFRRDIRLRVAEQIDTVIGRDRATIAAFVGSTEPGVLAAIAARLLDAVDPVETMHFTYRAGNRRVDVQTLLEAIRDLNGDGEPSPGKRLMVENFVIAELAISRGSRLDLYLTFLRLDEWEEALTRELSSLATELQVQAPVVYTDWDRHTNESEFRISCAVPIGVAAVAAAVWTAGVNGFTWSLLAVDGRSLDERLSRLGHVVTGAPLNYAVAAAALVAALVIHRSGVAARDRANDLMLTCLSRGVVKAASLPSTIEPDVLNWRSTRLDLLQSRDGVPDPEPAPDIWWRR